MTPTKRSNDGMVAVSWLVVIVAVLIFRQDAVVALMGGGIMTCLAIEINAI